MYSDALMTGNNLSLSEALAMGGETTVIGLSIVFGVLVILMIVLMLFKVIFYKDPNKRQKSANNAVSSVTQSVSEPITDTAADGGSDEIAEDELIAVLTAAVAASLNTSTYNLKIKSYRRIDKKAPAWNRAGVTETINNRF